RCPLQKSPSAQALILAHLVFSLSESVSSSPAPTTSRKPCGSGIAVVHAGARLRAPAEVSVVQQTPYRLPIDGSGVVVGIACRKVGGPIEVRFLHPDFREFRLRARRHDQV